MKKHLKSKEMTVPRIKKGTVIDHIYPPYHALNITNIVNEIPLKKRTRNITVSCAWNIKSPSAKDKDGKKGIVNNYFTFADRYSADMAYPIKAFRGIVFRHYPFQHNLSVGIGNA